MMKRHFVMALAFLTIATMTAGCLPTQTIIVKFEDLKQLKSDFMALESQLDNGEWAKFDWNTMTITISSRSSESPRPVALGAFPTPQAQTTNQGPVPVAEGSTAIRQLQYTDTVIQIMHRRQNRFKSIGDLKASGAIGESNRGYITRPDGQSLLMFDEETRKIIADENNDRRLLFFEVLRQNQWGNDKLAEVEQAFSEMQREIAKAGTWVQEADGSWHKK